MNMTLKLEYTVAVRVYCILVKSSFFKNSTKMTEVESIESLAGFDDSSAHPPTHPPAAYREADPERRRAFMQMSAADGSTVPAREQSQYL